MKCVLTCKTDIGVQISLFVVFVVIILSSYVLVNRAPWVSTI